MLPDSWMLEFAYGPACLHHSLPSVSWRFDSLKRRAEDAWTQTPRHPLAPKAPYVKASELKDLR